MLSHSNVEINRLPKALGFCNCVSTYRIKEATQPEKQHSHAVMSACVWFIILHDVQ